MHEVNVVSVKPVSSHVLEIRAVLCQAHQGSSESCWCLVSGVWCLGYGVLFLMSGVWCMVSCV